MVRENPASLVMDPAKELRTFRVARTGTLGTKRGRGRGSFIDSVLNGVDSFYGDVLGSLRAWSAAPPRLRPAHPEPPEVDESASASLVSADHSSQDGPEPASRDAAGASGDPAASAPENEDSAT